MNLISKLLTAAGAAMVLATPLAASAHDFSGGWHDRGWHEHGWREGWRAGPVWHGRAWRGDAWRWAGWGPADFGPGPLAYDGPIVEPGPGPIVYERRIVRPLRVLHRVAVRHSVHHGLVCATPAHRA